MAKYTSGRSLGITRHQLQALQMRADGKSDQEIARIIFDCTDGNGGADEKKEERAIGIVRKWFKTPRMVDAYRQYMSDLLVSFMGPAVKKLGEELTMPQTPWLENKAANDILSRAFPIVFGEEEKSIVVKVEGMPDLGTPDADEETVDDGE